MHKLAMNSISVNSWINLDINPVWRSTSGCFLAGMSKSVITAFLSLCLLVLSGVAGAVTSSEYFQIAPGNRFMWQVTANSTVSDVVSEAAVSQSLPNTIELVFSDGSRIFLSVDQQGGFQVNRIFRPSAAEIPPSSGNFVDVTNTFDPPLQIVAAEVNAGDQSLGSGTATVELAGVGSGTIPYSSLSTFIDIASVTVPAGTFSDTMHVEVSVSLSGTLLGQPYMQNLRFEQWVARAASYVKFIDEVDGVAATNELITSNLITPVNAVASSILPTSRSVQIGTVPATIFSTMINAGSVTATDCRITPVEFLRAGFSYQTTDPATNAPTGTVDTPVDIAANGGLQTFVLTLTPQEAFEQDVEFAFACTNSAFAGTIPGVNTLFLAASTTPVPDVIALASTPSGDGILTLPGSFGANAFAVATVNVGSQGIITASPDTGSSTLPLDLFICETNSTTGQCLTTPAASVTTTINANATPTFTIFANGRGDLIPLDPANNRIHVRYKDAANETRGSTSVAVESL